MDGREQSRDGGALAVGESSTALSGNASLVAEYSMGIVLSTDDLLPNEREAF